MFDPLTRTAPDLSIKRLKLTWTEKRSNYINNSLLTITKILLNVNQLVEGFLSKVYVVSIKKQAKENTNLPYETHSSAVKLLIVS